MIYELIKNITQWSVRASHGKHGSDTFNSMRGLYVRNDRNYSYLGTRSFSRTGDYTSRVLIMIDGRRMNDGVYDSGFIGEEFLLDMNLIERIEYIPGSGSSVYGANALLNINLALTKPYYGFQASLGVYNVLDQHYKVLGGSKHIQDTLSAERTARFRLKYEF